MQIEGLVEGDPGSTTHATPLPIYPAPGLWTIPWEDTPCWDLKEASSEVVAFLRKVFLDRVMEDVDHLPAPVDQKITSGLPVTRQRMQR